MSVVISRREGIAPEGAAVCCTYIYGRAESDIGSHYACNRINIEKGVTFIILHQSLTKTIGNSLQFLAGSRVATASQAIKDDLLGPSTNVLPALCSIRVFTYSEFSSGVSA